MARESGSANHGEGDAHDPPELPGAGPGPGEHVEGLVHPHEVAGQVAQVEWREGSGGGGSLGLSLLIALLIAAGRAANRRRSPRAMTA